jgi:hypothetical protein
LNQFDSSIDLRSRGEGMFWAGLGIAIQVSGLRGELIALFAWSAVGFGAILFAFGSPGLFHGGDRLKRPKRQRSRNRSIGLQAQGLGDRIVQFKRSRDSEEPRFLLPPDTSPLRPRQRGHEAHLRLEALARYWHETVSLYRREHAADARALLQVLRAQGILGEEEANRLCRPNDPQAIESVGLRLIELGDLLTRKRLDAA